MHPNTPNTPVSVLALCGPGGVGKTTVAYEVSAMLRAAQVAHVALDADELDRAFPLTAAEQHTLVRSNLAAFWANAAAQGRTRLLLTGVFVDLEAATALIEAAIPGARPTFVRLDASDAELERRVRKREVGSGVDGQLARTRAAASLLRERPTEGRVAVVTDGRLVRAIAEDALAAAGWLDQAPAEPRSCRPPS